MGRGRIGGRTMAETEKSLTWYAGKSEQEIEEHYQRAEDFLYRPWGSTGDRGQDVVTCGDFSLTPAQDTLCEDTEGAEESRARVEAFWVALAEWKAQEGVRAKIEDTLEALAFVDRAEDGTPNWTHLGEVLGVSRQTAQDRFKTYRKYAAAVQDIARRVGLE
jgi:hypothetical protein